MKRHFALLTMIFWLCLWLPSGSMPLFPTGGDTALAVTDGSSPTIRPELSLRHPRRGHWLTRIGDKLWVTGGRAYYSHFEKWGQASFEKFTSFPKVEVIDLSSGTVTYTPIDTKEPYFKSVAFTVSDEATTIYLAAANRLAKLDTEKMTLEEIKDFGEKGIRTRAAWGRMTIRGKPYVVIVAEDKSISFFDPGGEAFVKLEGVLAKIPVAGVGGATLDNKLYLFGGNPSGDDTGGRQAWVFDPNAEGKDQLTRIADLPIELSYPSAQAFDGKIYLFGGGSVGDMLRTVIEYEPARDRYVRRSDLPYAFNNAAVAIRGNTIYLSYGYSWGTAAEGKFGSRTHPEYVAAYQPRLDTIERSFGARESIVGDKMDLNLSWPDPDAIHGPRQTVAINWLAATSSDRGAVYYRKKGARTFERVAASGVTFSQGLSEARAYTATLRNLSPSTEYEYYAVSEGKTEVKSPLYPFRSQPRTPKKYQVFLYGDSKSEYNVTNELNGEILARVRDGLRPEKVHPAFLVHLGDFGSFGAIVEYEAYFNYTFQGKANTREILATFPFLPLHGNHEGLLPSYFNAFALPKASMRGWPALNNAEYEERWYSFNYGSAHYVVITTGAYLAEGWYTKTQLEWLKADLERAKRMKEAGKIRWVVLLSHVPFFTSGEHFADLDANGLLGPGSYLDVIESNGSVDLFLAGHDHDYERTKNIRGYRWVLTDGKPGYVKLDSAFAEETSGRFGKATRGKGTVYLVLGGAGAAQRSMFDTKRIGETSWMAARKPDPDRGEKAETHPAFHYAVLTVSEKELQVEVFEKGLSHLPEYKGADDAFEGLLDRITIQ
jgi:calcineurin-like phosphoesterase family protein/purple acid phosphatase-like protein